MLLEVGGGGITALTREKKLGRVCNQLPRPLVLLPTLRTRVTEDEFGY